MRRIVLAFLLVMLSTAAASAEGIRSFTYSYTLGSSTYVDTFSLSSSTQPESVQVDGEVGYAFRSVALNDDPTQRVDVTFTSLGSGVYGFDLSPTGNPSLMDFGVVNSPFFSVVDGSFSVLSQLVTFDLGGIEVGTNTLPFSSSSLKIATMVGPDPTPIPVAAMPEPNSLVLLGTGVAGLVARLRRRLPA